MDITNSNQDCRIPAISNGQVEPHQPGTGQSNTTAQKPVAAGVRGNDFARNLQVDLLSCALHVPKVLALITRTMLPSDWIMPASRFVWRCLMDWIRSYGTQPTPNELFDYVMQRCRSADPTGGDEMLALHPDDYKALAYLLERMLKATPATAEEVDPHLISHLERYLCEVRSATLIAAGGCTPPAMIRAGCATEVATTGNGCTQQDQQTPKIATAFYVASKHNVYSTSVRSGGPDSSIPQIIAGSQVKIDVPWVRCHGRYVLHVDGLKEDIADYVRLYSPDRVTVADVGQWVGFTERYFEVEPEVEKVVATVLDAIDRPHAQFPCLSLASACRRRGISQAGQQFDMALCAALGALSIRSDRWEYIARWHQLRREGVPIPERLLRMPLPWTGKEETFPYYMKIRGHYV